MPSNEESVLTKLQRIAEKAGSAPDFKFTSLFHLMNEEMLLGCFERLRENAASGIDGVTKEQYAGEASQYLMYSEKDFNEHINTCIRLQKVMGYLCYLCDFPEKLSTYFKIEKKKLLLLHEFDKFDAQPGSQEGLRE